MSEAILLTGKRGAGKSLCAIHLIEQAMREGRTVATNLDLFPERILSPLNRSVVYRLPDFPAPSMLEALPLGNPDPIDEARNGLLVLDECATFLNSRQWQGEDRQGLISWLAQSRKYGWDLILIAQHPRMIDAQIRESLVELHGISRRLDKIRVPFLGPLWKHFTGKPLKFPKIHIVTLFYGFQAGAPVSDRFIFRGSLLWDGYDSLQKISDTTGNKNLYTVLSPWHLKGRYMSKFDLYGRLATITAIIGLALGLTIGFVWGKQQRTVTGAVVESLETSASVIGVVAGDQFPMVVLTDGRVLPAMASKIDLSGERYQVGGKWFGVKK